MIEHPVPQNITQYEFHLIGNMTIKQFLMLLIGVIIGFLVYSTNLPALIMWPIIFVIVVTAIAMAFVPYEERTLDEWMANFVRAIYRPTKYYWRRLARTPDYFAYTTHQTAAQMAPQLDRTPLRRKQVSAFLSSINGPAASGTGFVDNDPLDLLGSSTESLNQLFDISPDSHKNAEADRAAHAKPNLKVRARPLGAASGNVFNSQSTKSSSAPIPAPIADLPAQSTLTGAILSMETEGENSSAASNENDTMPSHGSAKVVELKNEPVTITVEASAEPEPVAEPTEPVDPTAQTDQYLSAESASTIAATSALEPVIFNRDLPFPSLPDMPNLLLGMVHAGSAIVPSAIVEILDASGTTVRAMKTNSLGQFYISTPLKTGSYTIETEANGQQFPRYSLEVNDTVLDPIDIQAIS